ncbi:MAG: hypothetical protein PHE33_05445 [Bacteroidales bacterium]|nr:hypothetical protein [Bacteroidales bacterium]
MKTKVFILILVMFGLTFSSCKKYEDGPALSLKSKNARITGEWKLVAYSYERTSTSGITTSTYDGTTMITAYGSYPYSRTLIIDKDGTYTYKETNDGDTEEHTSYWSWIDGAKGKEQINFYSDDLYNIKKLANKELVFENTSSWKDYDDNSTTPTSFSTSTSTWTYEKQ